LHSFGEGGGGEISLLEGVADSLNQAPPFLQPGLAELLRHPGDYRQFIQANSLANFSFIARGAISSNPGDLFLNSTFEKTLAQLRQEYDYILIDSSPVFATDDATTLAPRWTERCSSCAAVFPAPAPSAKRSIYSINGKPACWAWS
jgi:hypothetical protein